MNGFDADSYFAIKAYLKYRSMVILGVGGGLSILIFGILVRIFERPFEGGSTHNFEFIWNAFWNVIVTMTTSKKLD